MITSDKSAGKWRPSHTRSAGGAAAIKKEKNKFICTSHAQGEMSDGAPRCLNWGTSGARLTGSATRTSRFHPVCASSVGFTGRIASDNSDIVCQKCQKPRETIPEHRTRTRFRGYPVGNPKSR
jgi:hypothetical protein